MDKMNEKKGNTNKQPKKMMKKKQPLKVVYISNPIKFNATASEFMALVQELTGQDAVDTPVDEDDGGGEAEEAAAEEADYLHAGLEKEVISNGEVDQEGSDPPAFGSFDDFFLCPEMMDNLCMFLKT
ncbi:hypothetical protein ACS0TY_031039 [Phlomoides rotata]